MNDVVLYGGDIKSFRTRFGLSEEKMSNLLGYKSRTPLRKLESMPKLDEKDSLNFLKVLARYEKFEEIDEDIINEYLEQLRLDYDETLSDNILNIDENKNYTSQYNSNDDFPTPVVAPPTTKSVGSHQMNYNSEKQTEKLANRFLEKAINENERENKQLRAEKEKLRDDLVKEQIDKTRLELRLDALTEKLSELNIKLNNQDSELKRRDDKIESLLEKLTNLETAYNEGLSDNTFELKQAEQSQKMIETLSPIIVEGMKWFGNRQQQVAQVPNGMYATQGIYYPQQGYYPQQQNVQHLNNTITEQDIDHNPNE